MRQHDSARPWLDYSALLDPSPMPLETGIKRLDDGSLLVAVRTDLHGCKGRMINWWFTFFETTQHIKWWHPVDHVEHRGWDANWKRGESFYGASIHAVESLAEIPPIPARLKFHHPARYLAKWLSTRQWGMGVSRQSLPQG
ncbi:hypothetical protein NHG68_16455 [Enterobacter sp. Z1]|nr:hypothetical protein NHG68_16455 [Enterobacter sp. Z1]